MVISKLVPNAMEQKKKLHIQLVPHVKVVEKRKCHVEHAMVKEKSG